MSANVQEYHRLDSAYFFAFEYTHDALKSGLAAASDLNVTQYRTLVKLLALHPAATPQVDLAKMLRLKPNMLTQTIDILQKHDYVQRERSSDDARSRLVSITPAGIAHVGIVNESIVKALYSTFPTRKAEYRRIFEASITAGAAIDPVVSEDLSKKYMSSRTLSTFELLKLALESALRKQVGASYNEARIMQLLGEVKEPMRMRNLSEQLALPSATITRSVDRLAARGWVQRLSDPVDRKAVFVVTTDSGKNRCNAIERVLDNVANTYLWANLSPRQQNAIAQAGHVVMADVQKRKEAERLEALGRLQPVG